MANYPEWVLKYKTKGYYVNKYKDHYRLYKGHCERINGKMLELLTFTAAQLQKKMDSFHLQALLKVIS